MRAQPAWLGGGGQGASLYPKRVGMGRGCPPELGMMERERRELLGSGLR